jgi:hypothetical protein
MKGIINLDDITKTLNFLHPANTTFEICAMKPNKQTFAGWFRDKGKALSEIQSMNADETVRQIYTTLNPCHDALLSRSNQHIEKVNSRTADKDILQINKLYLDVDPERPTDTNSSDEEHELAIQTAQAIKHDLSEQGWSEPLCGDSGNGGAVIYWIEEQPNNDETKKLLQNCLKALSQKYGTDKIKIDQTVHNPSRIAKVFGTFTRKGEHTIERPRRVARILSIPENPQPVTLEQLNALANTLQADTKQQKATQLYTGKVDVRNYLEHYGREIIKEKSQGDSILYCLKECLFDSSHSPNESAIVQGGNGALTYQCFHDSCQGRTWAEARQIISGTDSLKRFMVGGNFGNERGEGVEKDVMLDTEVTFDYDNNLMPETDFPFNVFKDDLLHIVNIASKAIHIEPEITAASMLTILSGAIGNTIRVSPKQGYTVPLFIWLIIIALSGYGKSPLMNLLMRHIKKLQSKTSMQYEQALKVYEQALRDAKHEKTTTIPSEPRLRHYEVADNTVESLAPIFKQDPRGTISNQDEIAGFIQGLNQYKGKGNDREQYLSFFNCESIKVDRKGKTLFVPNTGLSIIGGIQPKKMPTIFETDSFDDGFIARFLTINGKEHSIEFSREIMTDDEMQYWIDLIDYCYSIPLIIDDDGSVKYRTLILSEDAINAYIHFYNDYGRRMLFLTDRARVFIPKLIAYYCLKFAGVLHILNSHHSKIPSDKIPQLIDAETINHAISLTKYFAGQAIETVRLYDRKESLNELQVVLIQVLYDLREEVKGGKILLSRIVDEYNLRIPSAMTARAVSAILRNLGLTTEKMGQNLSYLIWEPARIEKLFNRTKVTNVTKVTKEAETLDKKVTKVTKVTVFQENQFQTNIPTPEVLDLEHEQVEIVE